MVSKVIRRWNVDLVDIGGSLYIPFDQAARQSVSADLGETLEPKKHPANIELAIGKNGMFLAVYFKKKGK